MGTGTEKGTPHVFLYCIYTVQYIYVHCCHSYHKIWKFLCLQNFEFVIFMYKYFWIPANFLKF